MEILSIALMVLIVFLVYKLFSGSKVLAKEIDKNIKSEKKVRIEEYVSKVGKSRISSFVLTLLF
ncbi:MAG: hypothetical protein GXP61_07985 [Epsilonproteobacteria bacterium]|nr:hypothetical protein [Campylobacterota bacterium]